MTSKPGDSFSDAAPCRPDCRPDRLTDDRLDELVRMAALSGPIEPAAGRDGVGGDGGGLPLMTRAMIGLGLVGVACLTVAVVVVVVVTRPATTGPLLAEQAGSGSSVNGREKATADLPIVVAEAADRTGPVEGRGAEPTPARSLVLARFTPEESEGLAFLFDGSGAGVEPSADSSDDPVAEPVVDPAARPRPVSPAPSSARLLALGRALHSADAARDTLALMSPAEQLEACRLWAAEPSLRPFAFERLSDLSMNPAVADDVRRAANELAADPAMSPWLQSYGLAFAEDAVPASASPPASATR